MRKYLTSLRLAISTQYGGWVDKYAIGQQRMADWHSRTAGAASHAKLTSAATSHILVAGSLQLARCVSPNDASSCKYRSVREPRHVSYGKKHHLLILFSFM